MVERVHRSYPTYRGRVVHGAAFTDARHAKGLRGSQIAIRQPRNHEIAIIDDLAVSRGRDLGRLVAAGRWCRLASCRRRSLPKIRTARLAGRDELRIDLRQWPG